MFRRNWCGLPAEAHFPSGLTELGYFVNDEDEVRSIANPDNYFHYFLNKNQRVNSRQRFEFDAAIRDIVHDRLEKLGLRKTAAAPTAPSSETKHVSIFLSKNLKDATRIIVVFGEYTKDLGVIAGRVATGPGGIDRGSMVSLVKAVQQRSDDTTGIVLANMGERFWWPQAKRSITVAASSSLPMPSLVHYGIKYDAQLNDVPGSETPLCHAQTIFRILREHANESAKINIIAMGDSCETIVAVLDEETWECASLESALFFAPAFCETIKQPWLKQFLANRARGYIVSEQPVDTAVSGPEGNPTKGVPAMGFPCYSSGEPSIDELCCITALPQGLAYLDQVAADLEYENEAVVLQSSPTLDSSLAFFPAATA